VLRPRSAVDITGHVLQLDFGFMTGRNRPIVLKNSTRLATHALSGESAFFAHCYVKSEPRTLCPKLGFQSQTRTFLPWKLKRLFQQNRP
jgi:hypothetical protein